MNRPAVEDIEHLWIPMADGVRLAARAWLPRERPCPALIELIPYGKRWGTRERDESLHPPLAARGVACLRVDVRGSGDSEGLLDDEYSEAELTDGEALVAWAAAQPWCDGRVFLLGKSWGGFNALQLAARRPPALAGVVTVCASDDRYGNDAHYMGGCLLNENQVWGAMLFALAAEPPCPEILEEGWRDLWLARLQHVLPYAARWLAHPRFDDYWQRGSVCADYQSIAFPVFVVGGWADAYTDGAVRLARRLTGPTRTLIGPWTHLYPHQRGVGPRLPFPDLVADWIEGRAAHESRIWIESATGGAFHAIGAERLDGDRRESIQLTDRNWFPVGPEDPSVELASPHSLGSASGSWCPFGADGMATDQDVDDQRSLRFETAPLDRPMTVLGPARLEVLLRTEGPTLLCARLVAVDPDGAARRVAYGILQVDPAPVGTRATVELTACGHRFEPGQRLRLSLSSAYWPIAWPAQRVAGQILELDLNQAVLSLPVLDTTPEPVAMQGEPPADTGHPGANTRLTRHGTRTRMVRASGFDADGLPTLHRFESIATATGFAARRSYWIDDDDPLSARCQVTTLARFQAEDYDLLIMTSSRLRADADHFHYAVRLWAFEDGQRVHSARWVERVAR